MVVCLSLSVIFLLPPASRGARAFRNATMAERRPAAAVSTSDRVSSMERVRASTRAAAVDPSRLHVAVVCRS